MNKTLIIGLGNPILGDDGVGWVVADNISQKLPSPSMGEGLGMGVEIERLSLGGLSLMERMSGYERVILIDAMQTGLNPLGNVSVFPLTELPNPFSGHSASTHDTSLLTALDTGRQLGVSLPNNDDITVIAIEAENVYDFSETLSPSVSAAVPTAAQYVIDLL